MRALRAGIFIAAPAGRLGNAVCRAIGHVACLRSSDNADAG
jgi:hypothetical protein